MSHVTRSLLAVLLFCVSLGCAPDATRFRALPAPQVETPAINPPLSIRQKNWLGPNSEGSCVHASLSSMLHWQNQFARAEEWRTKYAGGEYSDRLRKRLDDERIPYAYTERANLQLLDDAHATRRGALLWWKPSHCCTFVGWVKSQDNRVYAVILDNNAVGRYEFVERAAFHRQWAGFGGFALMTLYDPPSPPVWKSYEAITESWKW